MHMMTVKAIADGSGPDITGRTVPMPAGSYHLCREDDRTWFEQRSDVFELQARDDTESPVTATRDASGAVVWLSAGEEIDLQVGGIVKASRRIWPGYNTKNPLQSVLLPAGTAWIKGYDTTSGFLDLLDWLAEQRDVNGWQLRKWSDWYDDQLDTVSSLPL